MSRPIDADALKKSVLDLHDCYNGFSDTYDKACIIGIIDEQPTIEERKKGKWIPHKELSREYIGSALVSIRYDYWYCDRCGYKVENGQPTYNYCPNCGARMRGGDRMIICGFPGTGKSMMAKLSNWVDLESTPFEKDWWRYAKVAKHMSDQDYTVMVSTHRELLECFEQMEVSHTVVVPSVTDKDNYLHRYKSRGNTEEFIETVRTNWKNWIYNILLYPSVLRTVVILPKDGCIRAWAEEYKKCGHC